LPEWADQYVMPLADGQTDEEALARGRTALENARDFAPADGKSLPPPRVFVNA
jgi:predicted RNase H-like HicB family nuclease